MSDYTVVWNIKGWQVNDADERTVAGPFTKQEGEGLDSEDTGREQARRECERLNNG